MAIYRKINVENCNICKIYITVDMLNLQYNILFYISSLLWLCVVIYLIVIKINCS